MSLSLPKAELTGAFLESLSYGVYILIFIQCMHVLWKRYTRPSDYLLGTAVSLFILITVHLVVDILRNMEAFTSNMGTPNYATDYYFTYDAWKNIVKSAVYVSVTVVSDAFILYRTFIVWGRNYIISVVPFLLFLADIAIGILWVYTLSLVSPGDNVYTDSLSVRVKTFYSITLAMNFLCTGLIATKIWKIQRAIAPFVKESQDDLSRLVAIIVESGSAYSTILVVTLATYASKSPVMFIFLNTLPPIIGIVFSSVIVRVGLGLSHGDSDSRTSRTTSSQTRSDFRTRRGLIASERFTTDRSRRHFPGGSIQVALSHTVHTRVDGLQAEEVDIDKGCTDVERGECEYFHAV